MHQQRRTTRRFQTVGLVAKRKQTNRAQDAASHTARARKGSSPKESDALYQPLEKCRMKRHAIRINIRRGETSR